MRWARRVCRCTAFLDGFAIGLAFQVSNSVGLIVAAAVLAHDFSDGINTVGVVLNRRGGSRLALGWLIVDATAPVVGAAATLLLRLPANVLGGGLAVFAGFFIYISASDLLPESYHDHPTVWTTAMTLLGMAVVYSPSTSRRSSLVQRALEDQPPPGSGS